MGNDLYSYEKEYEDTMRAGLPDVVNAIWVIMGEHGCTEAEAKEICKERIRQENAKYVKVVEETRKRTDLSDDVRRYIDVMQYSLSGNLVWSIQCPRYNKGSTFSELQMLRAKHGVAKYPALWPPKDGANGTAHRNDSAVDLTTNGTTEEEPKENDENMYWGINGVGIRVGNGVDAHGVGTYDAAPTIDQSTEVKTNGIEIVNGERKSAHHSKPSTDSLELDNVVALALDKNLPELGEGVVLQPWKYLNSLPSKGFRDQAIDSLNTWLKVPRETASKIKEVVKLLHNASLM